MFTHLKPSKPMSKPISKVVDVIYHGAWMPLGHP